MYVIHLYSLLGSVHAVVYVPAGSPAVGQPMEASRMLGQSMRSFGPAPVEDEIVAAVAACFEQMRSEGIDVAAVLDV